MMLETFRIGLQSTFGTMFCLDCVDPTILMIEKTAAPCLLHAEQSKSAGSLTKTKTHSYNVIFETGF